MITSTTSRRAGSPSAQITVKNASQFLFPTTTSMETNSNTKMSSIGMMRRSNFFSSSASSMFVGYYVSSVATVSSLFLNSTRAINLKNEFTQNNVSTNEKSAYLRGYETTPSIADTPRLNALLSATQTTFQHARQQQLMQNYKHKRAIMKSTAERKSSVKKHQTARSVLDFFSPSTIEETTTPKTTTIVQQVSDLEDLSPRRGIPQTHKPFQPQLAVTWDADRAAKFPEDHKLMVSLKLDGIRCLIKNRSTMGKYVTAQVFMKNKKEIVAVSRHGNEFHSCQRIKDALGPLFEMFPTLVLDGELYHHDIDDFNELSGAVRNIGASLPSERVQKIQSELQFFVFDIAAWKKINVSETPYELRMQILRKLLRAGVEPKNLALPAPIKSDLSTQRTRMQAMNALHNTFIQSSKSGKPIALLDSVEVLKQDIDPCLDFAVKKQLEGVMIRHANSAYHHSRSPALMKAKRFADEEYKIIGFLEGTGAWEGLLAAFVLQGPDGRKFKGVFSATEEVKRQYWLNRKKYVGWYATVQYQEKSPNGIPRFPIVKGVRGKSTKNFV